MMKTCYCSLLITGVNIVPVTAKIITKEIEYVILGGYNTIQNLINMNLILLLYFFAFMCTLMPRSILFLLWLILELANHNRDYEIKLIKLKSEEKSNPHNFDSIVITKGSAVDEQVENTECMKTSEFRVNCKYKIASMSISSETKWFTKPYYYNRSDW